VKGLALLLLDAPQQTTEHRDLEVKPLGCPMTAGDEDLICPLTGNNSCPSDPSRVAKCPSC
jgi:hypothetical protein